jgi:hypothetical protein
VIEQENNGSETQQQNWVIEKTTRSVNPISITAFCADKRCKIHSILNRYVKHQGRTNAHSTTHNMDMRMTYAYNKKKIIIKNK